MSTIGAPLCGTFMRSLYLHIQQNFAIEEVLTYADYFNEQNVNSELFADEN